jgi:hypothetical protein
LAAAGTRWHRASRAASPGVRPGNTYVREDQILPHLAALAILLAGRTTELTIGKKTADWF